MKTEASNPSESERRSDQILSETCANCGEILIGEYCHQCGEKPMSHHDLTVKHFLLHTVVHEFTHLNGGIFKTLKLLIAKPGFLAYEYFAGRKSRYINPLRLYLTLSLLFFFASSLASEGNVSIQAVAKSEPTGFLSKVVEEKAGTVDLESESVKQKIHDKTKTVNVVLSLTQVLFIGLVFMAIYYSSRRYYVEHLVLALYFVSFFLIVLTILALLGVVFVKTADLLNLSEVLRYGIARGFQFWIPLGTLAIYLFFAFRLFYKSSIKRAVIGIPLVLIVSIAIQNILSWIGYLIIVGSL